MNHFDEVTCMLYLDGQLDAVRAAQLDAHLEVCAKCHTLLRALERESRLLHHALVEEDEAVPARLLSLPARESTPWAWIAALGFGAAGAYTLWTGLVEPWMQQLNQAGFGGGGLLAMLFFGGVFQGGWSEMWNVMQLLALVTLGMLVVMLVGRNWRRLPFAGGGGSGPGATIGLVMGALAVVLALPPAAGAADIKRGQDTYTLPAGETVKNDLIIFGRTARIEGTVEGDLIFIGQSLTVNGHVTGDVLFLGHTLRVNGPVDGNVRAVLNTLLLGGQVGKNVSAGGEMFESDSKSTVGGGVMFAGQSATHQGRIGRDLMSYGGSLTLDGFVGGNLLTRLDHGLTIASLAEVRGEAKYAGRRQPTVSPQAKLASPLKIEIVKSTPDYASPRFYWRQCLRWAAAFIFGFVTLLLMPSFFADAVRAGDRAGPSLGLGALALVATPFLAIIACITIVGLAVGIGAVLLWIILIYAAQVFVGTWLGGKMLGESAGTGATIGRLALGLLAIRILGNVPYLGGWIWLVVILWGMGAFVLAAYRRMQPTPVAAV